MDNLDKLIDRLGIYDVVAVLLPGACMLLLALILEDWLPFCIPSIHLDKLNANFVFLLLSYIVGLVLQEVGSYMYNRIFRRDEKNLIIEYVLESAVQSDKKEKVHSILSICDPQRIRLTNSEKKILTAKYNSITDNKNYDEIFNMCKWKLIQKKKTARIDKEQSLSSMSRSLSLGFLIYVILTVIKCFQTKDIWCVYRIIIFLFLSALFFVRTLRFQMLRYAYTFRNLCYTGTGEKDDDSIQKS